MQNGDKEIVMRSLSSVGMEAYAGRTMDKMSDGECQRIMIARALAQSTPIILLDEPTSFLDMPNRYELCTLLHGWRATKGNVSCFPPTSWTSPSRARRRDSSYRLAASALPANRRDGLQRTYRTAVQQCRRALRPREREREIQTVASF